MNEQLAALYGKDTGAAYRSLLELEALSELDDSLYAYVDEFLEMLASDEYVLRVRGFRLLCKQARWDRDAKLDRSIDTILAALDDEKPTAVRQALQALGEVVAHKPGLHDPIRARLLALDPTRYRATMSGLIAKDIQELLRAM